MQGYVRYLILGTCLLFCSHISNAQNAGIDDLPECAKPCARTAATAAGCSLSDTSCLCSHPNFSNATIQCSRSSCPIEDQSSVNGVLREMCADAPSAPPTSTTSVTSASSTSTSSNAAATPTSTTATTNTSTSSSSSTTRVSTPTTANTTPTRNVASLGTSGSSTVVVVVQTVDIPPPFSSGAAGRVEVALFSKGTQLAMLLGLAPALLVLLRA
ncbi:hypothetical protein B0H34DRAFT_390398 [Crassisporium funariophilum]|nr:hypothetical protein B0H34DRAFT_390398 [Crassisporium funariophilum]